MERIAITVITEDHYFYKETTIAFVNSDGTGIAFPILQDMSIYGSRGYLTWSHNGRYLAFDGGDTVTCPDVLGTECYELNYGTFIADYAQDTILYHIKDTFANVSWSPDSDHLILSKQRDEGRFVNDLYILDVNSGQLKQLTNGPSNDLYPSWSPDRQWISFLRFNPDIPGCSSTPSIDFENEKCNQASLYRIHPDGSDLQLLFETVFIYRKPSLGEEVSNAPAWSPDSKWLAFLTKNENGLHDQSDISILNLETDERRLAIRVRGFEVAISPIWSPIGQKLAFALDRNGNFDIFVWDMQEDSIVNLTLTPNDGDFFPSWSPSEAHIAYISDGNLVIMNADGTNKVFIDEEDFGMVIGIPAWQPDGQP